ncbi:MAG: hypothetical protein JW833_01395 [Prolixibacteraceae bacterium]|nr:hypothetical protein [Prolixibacteraceae bacterium]
MKTFRLLLVVIFLAFGLGSCEYTFWVPEPVPEIPDPNDPNAEQISFAQTIQPIFTNSCVECHTTGKQLPDLSEGNAFSSINTSRYLNTSTPEESLIYIHPNPDSNTHSQRKYTATQAQNVLIWITQGAKNN